MIRRFITSRRALARSPESSREAGFTLIELMVVVAIVALLAMFGVPQYVNHTQKTKLTGALSGIAAYKLAVAACIQETGTLAGCSAGTHDIPAAIATNNNGAIIKFVDALTVTDGVITVTSTGKLGDAPGTKMALTMTPSAPASSPAAVNWAMTGNGCSSATNARGVACTAS